MQKVPGVTSVRVSLNEGLTSLELAPGNTVTLLRLRDVIRNNGFVTKEARVTVSGTVRLVDRQLTLEIAVSREAITLTAVETSVLENLRAAIGTAAPIVVNGRADLTNPKALTLSVSSVGRR
jgi:hypothetical protein